MQKNNQIFIFCQTVISDSFIPFSVLGSALFFPPFFKLCVYKLICFPLHCRTVLKSISRALLCGWPSIRHCIYFGFDVLYKDVALWMLLMVLLLLAEDQPPCSKGLTPAHAICMELSDNEGGSERCILNTNA